MMTDQRKVKFAKQISEIGMTERPTALGVHRSKSITIKSEQLKVHRGSLGLIEDLIQCTFCMGKLNDPRMLVCQHTFCLSCLQSHLGSDGNEFKCPTCDELIYLKNGTRTLDDLPGNMYIDSLLKVLAGSPKTPSLATGEIRCITCQTVYDMTSLHSCQHCKQLFCGVCWSKHILDLNSKIKLLLEQLDGSFVRLKHRLESFEDQCSQLQESVHKTAEKKIQEIKVKEKNCLGQIEEFKHTAVKSSENLKMRMVQLQKKILDQRFSKITDDNKKVNDFISYHRETSSLLDELSHWGETHPVLNSSTFKIETESSIDVEDEMEDVAVEVKGILNPMKDEETLSLYYRSRSFTPRMVWTKYLRPAKVVISPWSNNCLYISGTDSRYILGIDYHTGKLQQRLTSSEMLYPVGLATSFTREEIYVTDKWKHCIHVFSKTGQYLRCLGKKGSLDGQFRSPEGIAIDAENKLYVCDTGNDRIKIINPEDGKLIFQFGIVGIKKDPVEMGTTIKYTELNSPTDIAVTDHNIIVADSGNCRIKIYTLTGTKLLEFGSLGKNRGQFRTPETVAIDSMGFILVGDSGNARVQIFKPDGSLVRVFNNKGKFGWISGLCVTPQLDVIVTDYKSHSVYIF